MRDFRKGVNISTDVAVLEQNDDGIQHKAKISYHTLPYAKKFFDDFEDLVKHHLGHLRFLRYQTPMISLHVTRYSFDLSEMFMALF